MAVRVVSLPAVTSNTKNDANSCCVNFSSSISAFTRALVMSSMGFSIRYLPRSSIIWVSVAPASKVARIGSVPSGMMSGSPMERMTFEHSRAVWYSLGGTPIMSQIIWMGNGAAMSFTKSPEPDVAARVITSSATRSMESSTERTFLGLKAFETMRRSRACLGLSVEIMPEKYSTISVGRSIVETAPGPERKTSGWRLAVATSTYLVSA